MKRARRAKLSITVDPVIHEAISRHAERARISKSRLVEDALRLWEKNRLALLAKEGYQRMAEEDERDAEAYLPVLDELEGE